jgi:hypothetical protein
MPNIILFILTAVRASPIAELPELDFSPRNLHLGARDMTASEESQDQVTYIFSPSGKLIIIE